MQFEPVIGLEVHAQLLTKSKIFCPCSTQFGAEPNHNTCPICRGLPGVLPVLNRKVVEYAIKMGLATNCRINPRSSFSRKNYFYPDLPKGYQISQYDQPLAVAGHVKIDVAGGQKKIGIIRIHLEEDAGKLIHDNFAPVSYVDLNRAGVPLIEIVSAPELTSPEEASVYLKAIHEILVYLGICDGNMEEGSFRCDANVSVRPVGQLTFGTRTELKNLNSFRFVQRAVEYEIKRQTSLLERGGRVTQETRLWDEARGATLPMRGKEDAHDYRYFPDPDLVPLVVAPEWVDEISSSLPELPQAKRDRFASQYQLPPYDVGVLTASASLANYFEEVTALTGQPKQASNWIMAELLAHLNEDKKNIEDCPVSPPQLASLLDLVNQGKLSGKMGKDIFAKMYASGQSPEAIIAREGLAQITDRDSLDATIRAIVEANPDQVEQYRAGREKVFGFFVGQVMKATAGRANPQIINELLKKALS